MQTQTRFISDGAPYFMQLCGLNQPRYTGKERDSESGLDMFGARYYGSSLGRFMTPDWSDKHEPVAYSQLDNPQSLNIYGYVLNNPMTRVDLDGHSSLVYDARAQTVTLYTKDGQKVGTWHAGNNVASTAHYKSGSGIQPLHNGTYSFADKSSSHKHPGEKDHHDSNMRDSSKGEFGKNGILRLEKSAENPDGGKGMHAGREGEPDGRGRTGPDHATEGCLRTTEAAMDATVATAKADPLTTLTVVNAKESPAQHDGYASGVDGDVASKMPPR